MQYHPFIGGKIGGEKMPKRARELGALDVKRLTHPGHGGNVQKPVGGVAGLRLQITPSNAASWVLRTAVGPKTREIGLGPYPEVSLAAARDKARLIREDIRNGIDPIEAKRSAKAQLVISQKRGLTFDEAAARYLPSKSVEFKNAKHAAQWRSTLATYASPAIGPMQVADIVMADILRVLEPIWRTKTETADRVRGRIERVLAWATVAGHRDGDNPARWKGNLDAVLPKPGKVAKVENHGALALTAVSGWYSELLKRDGIAAKALAFQALTAARSGEVRGARWDEIDLDQGIWTVPASRMKARREHRVALSKPALDLLSALPRVDGSPLVFPAARGGPLSDATLSAVMRRMHAEALANGGPGYLDAKSSRPAVPHGLRSTFRDWSAERTTYPREMAEIALAHQVGSEVERAYRRSDMVERRRAMMADWADFLLGKKSGKVVALSRRTGS